ncbi:MAG: sulfatase [Solobacterium sp.]|nr:sulfatase [Solobacterium sp.]
MRAVMVMYDSLRLDMLPCYGGKEVELPNFKRLAEKTAIFDSSYVCSMPCMPARRELHTGRANFLHRSWGPIEPFDDSMPEILKNNGIYTRIVTDHNHYIEDGGASYVQRYNTWECNRGQEGDPWQGYAGEVGENIHAHPVADGTPAIYGRSLKRLRDNDMLNREAMKKEEDYPQAKTFAQGVEFLERNHDVDNWYLQIETFDPHEPFTVPDKYISRICDPDTVGDLDWPSYAPVTEPEEEIRSFRMHYLALLSFCDESLGKVLDEFDKYDLWKDTMLIVNTDHGFLLTEHGWWAKGSPYYQEIVHTPLFIWDPRLGVKGERRNAVVQTIDLAPTLLEYFGQEIPKDMIGRPLKDVIAADTPVREYAVFGNHGGTLYVTDGRYKLMLAVKENPPELYDYTLMPTHMRERFSVAEMQSAEYVEPFSFTKGCKLLKVHCPQITAGGAGQLQPGEEWLFDLVNDPKEECRINYPEVIARMKAGALAVLKENDAPEEIINRYNLV